MANAKMQRSMYENMVTSTEERRKKEKESKGRREEENGTHARLGSAQHHNMRKEQGRVLRNVVSEAEAALMISCIVAKKRTSHASPRTVVQSQ
jgi:hypothetical protein